MRKQIITVVAAGALGLTGLAIAGPAALAAVGAEDSATALTSRVDRIKEALSGLVTDGTLTQEQADKVATTLDSADIGGGRGHGGPGGHGPGRDLSTAATALGITEDELRTALQADGATLASVAKDKGVAVDTLISALVEAEKTRIAQAATDGRITQAQADERLADLEARVTERVNSTLPVRGDHGMRGDGFAPETAPDSSTTPAPSPSASTSSYAS